MTCIIKNLKSNFSNNIKLMILSLVMIMISNVDSVNAEDKNPNWKPTSMFLLGGQSNMSGAALSKDLPKEFSKFPPNVRMWEENTWAEMKLGEKYGPEVGFAFEMAKKWPKEKIGLVKLGSSGTNMLVWAGEAIDPKTKKETPFGGNYNAWTQMMTKAQKSAPDAVLKGVLWMQGESDAQYLELSDNYKTNLKKIINGLRTEFNNKTLPFLIGKIQAKNFKFLATVWKAQEETAKEVPNTCWVNTDSVELNPDVLHFSSKGQIDLGRIFAEEFLKMTSKQKKK
jgi:hypothetical protein